VRCPSSRRKEKVISAAVLPSPLTFIPTGKLSGGYGHLREILRRRTPFSPEAVRVLPSCAAHSGSSVCRVAQGFVQTSVYHHQSPDLYFLGSMHGEGGGKSRAGGDFLQNVRFRLLRPPAP